MKASLIRVGFACALAALVSACATPTPVDLTAFKANRPASLLVLPPLNDTADVQATAGVMATVTLPLAEAGYYVMPVGLVDETFKQNGLTTPADIHEVAAGKLREIFGADAAVYLRVTEYGTKYMLIGSDTRVTVEGRIIDLRSGATLWSGKATASSEESSGASQGGLVGLLVTAVVKQIVNSTIDASFGIAVIANSRLLTSAPPMGILAGPRAAVKTP